MATMTITGTREDISEIIDIEGMYNFECENGEELNAILVDANNLKWIGPDSAVCNLQEVIENYEFDDIKISNA
jgi:hypothetical protein